MGRLPVCRIARRSLASLVLLAPILVWSTAQSAPNSAKEGLQTGSPPSVLNDPVVQRCRMLAARRMDPSLDSVTTAVDLAASAIQLEPVFDAVATCRAALAVYPTEPKVIIAHYNASEALLVLALGIKFPDSEEAIFNMAIEHIGEQQNDSGMMGQILGFFLGSAFEYGVGTAPNRAAAMKWYGVAAAAGDPISKRELMRLQDAKQ
jgi:hypothetical protein